MLNTCQMVYHHKNCLNTKRPYAKPCRLCIDACPHQAISEYREIDGKRCTECGVCMAVCPSDGMVDRNTDLLHQYIEETDGDIILNCPEASSLGFEISCLGIIDHDLWLTLIQLAKERKITIHTGKCVECPDKKACALSVKIFKEVHEDWPDHPPILIKVSPDQPVGDASTSSNVKQASLPKTKATEKKGWRNKGWEKLENILPGLTADEAYSIPRTRELLVRQMSARSQDKIPLPALQVKDACTSCGVCVAICPQAALTKKEDGDELSIIYEPYKCVRCQRCVNICNPKALDFAKKKLSHRHFTGKILLHKGSPKHCVRCGKQVFDNTEPPLCIACASSHSDSIISPKTEKHG
ncbi:MAG: 4Fe-4S dicluster domain-containing protein [Desulfitobacterium sp.]